MATEKAKLAWQPLKADDVSLPSDLQEAIANYEMARDTVEELVRKHKPAPKGKRWTFSYRFGVSAAHAPTNGGEVNYFA